MTRVQGATSQTVAARTRAANRDAAEQIAIAEKRRALNEAGLWWKARALSDKRRSLVVTAGNAVIARLANGGGYQVTVRDKSLRFDRPAQVARYLRTLTGKPAPKAVQPARRSPVVGWRPIEAPPVRSPLVGWRPIVVQAAPAAVEADLSTPTDFEAWVDAFRAAHGLAPKRRAAAAA